MTERWTVEDQRMLETESKTLSAQQAVLKMKLDLALAELDRAAGSTPLGRLL